LTLSFGDGTDAARTAADEAAPGVARPEEDGPGEPRSPWRWRSAPQALAPDRKAASSTDMRELALRAFKDGVEDELVMPLPLEPGRPAGLPASPRRLGGLASPERAGGSAAAPALGAAAVEATGARNIDGGRGRGGDQTGPSIGTQGIPSSDEAAPMALPREPFRLPLRLPLRLPVRRRGSKRSAAPTARRRTMPLPIKQEGWGRTASCCFVAGVAGAPASGGRRAVPPPLNLVVATSDAASRDHIAKLPGDQRWNL